MHHLEPTYLRYIYDGLIKGSIHPENAAELPDGLIGLYEEAFDERTSVVERQKLLQRFAIWTLLKKEVSASFVAEVLGDTEDEIQDFISKYSAWFNSPESGKYQLYHERLKVYLLQKLSEKEIHELHEKLISRLEKAIEEQQADEFEWYGLEFLAGHLGANAMLNGNGCKLLALAYDQAHWQRQLKISKGFNWTKTGLKAVMAWASKYNEDEVIECGLQMVDLHHQEQNAAPQIVALVAEGDFDSALKRIEHFSGNDKEGLKRKFILYMLCLMELTLLESKDKPFRKEGIEKLLKHLDEQLPVDHSILTWNNFFPSYTVFLMFFEWAALGLDYLIVNKRTDDWNGLIKSSSNPYFLFPIKENGPYSNLQFEVLKECARSLCSEKLKSRYLAIISTELKKQRQIEKAASTIQEALEYARDISDDLIKCIALANISTELIKQSQIEKARFLLSEAIENARGISNEFVQKEAIEHINNEKMYCCIELAKQEKVNEAIRFAQDISDDSIKSIAIANISTELTKLGKIKEAQIQIKLSLKCARSLNFELSRATPLAKISTELAKQGKIEEAASVMQEALNCYRNISFDDHFFDLVKNIGLTDISTELAKQGKIEEAFNCTKDINDYSDKSTAVLAISSEFAKQGKIEKALDCTKHINVNSDKSKALMNISTMLFKNGKLEDAALFMQEAFKYHQEINYDYFKSAVLANIAKDLAKQGATEEALEYLSGITYWREKREALNYISIQFATKGKYEEAVECALSMYNMFELSESGVKDVTTELYSQGRAEEVRSFISSTLKCLKSMPYSVSKVYALAAISIELAKHGEIEEALTCARGIINSQGEIEEELTFARGIINSQKIMSLTAISTELFKKGKIKEAASVIEEAFTCARGISSDTHFNFDKSLCLSLISTELTKQCKIAEALKLVRRIKNGYIQDNSLKDISTELANQEKIKKAIELARRIKNEEVKIEALANISAELSKHGKVEEASSIIQEALDYAHDIGDETEKSSALKCIAIELIKKRNWSLAEKIGCEITKIIERQDCFKLFGKISSEKIDVFESLNGFKRLNTLEARFFYLKGWLENLKLNSANKEITINTILFIKEDMISIERLLILHTLNQFFFEKIPEEKIQRFNRTLNLQWAIDIKNQLPN